MEGIELWGVAQKGEKPTFLGVYSSIGEAVKRGQYLLGRGLISDYALPTRDGLLMPVRPSKSCQLPKPPRYSPLRP